MFTGEYHHTIDDKNRMAIPVPLRDSIDVKTDGKGFFVTRGPTSACSCILQRMAEGRFENRTNLFYK